MFILKVKPGIHFAAIFLLILCGCGKKEKLNEPDPQNLRKEIPPTEVITVTAVRKPFEYLIQAAAKIESASEVQIKFKRQGTVKEVRVRNGQVVKQGDILAVLDYERQELHLQKARLAYEEKLLVFRDQMLSYQGADSVRQKRAEAAIRISSGLASAETALREAELEYQFTFVRAEISGVVSDIQVKPGNPVSDGQVFCRLHNPNEMLAIAEVLESDAGYLRSGISAVVRPAGGDKDITGLVTELNPRVDEKTGMVKVSIRLPGNTGLLPGMRAQAIIKIPGNRHIVVPKEAVVMRSGRPVVFTAEEGLAKWNYVVTGRENGREIEILEGLKEGQRLIISNNLQLAHDAPIVEKNY